MSTTGLKIAIIILFIAMVASLSSGLVFLVKDISRSESKRTLIALGVRVTLAAALMGTIGYGIYSGKLSNTAPWGEHRQAPATQQ
ncbi:DUF2909 domain-containing protein [Teredinibacter franksiae]|jgi:Protein of unknown function (DUF2909).|uniref:DUF2909 domain-containing protein n=1 Tax=Teredinibacter franksiae TaxID=2761453 RepID=UPI001629AFEA|nr:DUF2909 domain-containing protein [Teredinibacter franksiae]